MRLDRHGNSRSQGVLPCADGKRGGAGYSFLCCPRPHRQATQEGTDPKAGNGERRDRRFGPLIKFLRRPAVMPRSPGDVRCRSVSTSASIAKRSLRSETFFRNEAGLLFNVQAVTVRKFYGRSPL